MSCEVVRGSAKQNDVYDLVRPRTTSYGLVRPAVASGLESGFWNPEIWESGNLEIWTGNLESGICNFLPGLTPFLRNLIIWKSRNLLACIDFSEKNNGVQQFTSVPSCHGYVIQSSGR